MGETSSRTGKTLEVASTAALGWRLVSRIFSVSFASVYPHYVTKVEKKGRTKAELDQVIDWLTGFDQSELDATSGGRHDLRGLLR